MTDQAAAFKGTFHDMKFVKGRKQAQIIVEIPIEHAAAVVAAFGAPNPENPVWIALARLDIQPAKEEPKPKNREAQKAGMLCDDPRFQAFVWEQIPSVEHLQTYHEADRKENAENYIREFCGVTSRKDLTPDNESWKHLQAEYELWLRS